MKISKIKETCIYVTDLEQTRVFYNEKLKLPLISVVEGRHIFFRAGESVLLCFIASSTEKENVLPPHGARGSIHLAFEVKGNEYLTIKEFIEELKIEILYEQVWRNNKRSFYFHDPDKNLVEIIEEGLWESGV